MAGIDSFANAQSPLRGGSASLRRPLTQLPLRSSRTVIWTRVERGSKILPLIRLLTKKGPPIGGPFFVNGGEGGIRTLDGLLTHTPLAGERFRPLSHFSVNLFVYPA